MKRQKLTLLLLAVMVLSVMTFETKAKTSALPAEVRVGGVFPIVQRPDAGPDRRDGFLLAIAEINNQSGPSRILPEETTLLPNVQDDDNSAAGGTAAAQTLISWGADIVIGSSGSSVSAAMATELTPQKIVQISYASSSPALSDRTLYPYFMRVAASDADQGKAIADLVEKFGWETGATISTSDSYGTGLIDIFDQNWDGTIATAQQFDAGATDVSSQVQAIKDADPEFVVGNFIDVDAATCMKKAHELGIDNIPWLMTDGWSTTATFATDDDVKSAMQMQIGTTPAPITAAGYQTFNDTWYDAASAWLEGPARSQGGGAHFNSYAPFAYDAVYVAAKGLAAADSVDGDDLLAALYDVTHPGASGNIVFNALGEVVGRYDYVQLEDETYTSFGTYDIPSGATTASPILDDTDLLELADGSEWSIADNVVTLEKEAGAGAPGFGYLSLLFVGGVLVIIRKRRK